MDQASEVKVEKEQSTELCSIHSDKEATFQCIQCENYYCDEHLNYDKDICYQCINDSQDLSIAITLILLVIPVLVIYMSIQFVN